MTNGCEIKFNFQTRFEVLEKARQEVIAAYQIFVESQNNLGWEASLETIWSNLLLKGYPCQAKARVFPAGRFRYFSLTYSSVVFSLVVNWVFSFISRPIFPLKQLKPIASYLVRAYPCEQGTAIISLITFWVLEIHIPNPSCAKFSCCLIILVALCCTFSIFYCFFEMGGSKLGKVFQTWPDKC